MPSAQIEVEVNLAACRFVKISVRQISVLTSFRKLLAKSDKNNITRCKIIYGFEIFNGRKVGQADQHNSFHLWESNSRQAISSVLVSTTLLSVAKGFPL